MDEILQNFYASAERLRNTMAQMAEGIDGINIAVDESAQGVTVAAQSTGALVEATSCEFELFFLVCESIIAIFAMF